MPRTAPRTQGTLTHYRRGGGNRAAILFIHGFAGHPERTWRAFPRLLTEDRALKGLDVYSLGYPTGFWLDLAGIWKAHPPIESLADGLRTQATLTPLSRYESLVLIAHSMGGLVVQRALVDGEDFAERVGSVFLFGTPSDGLRKASFFRFWKRQLRAMEKDGTFIQDLRRRWDAAFGTQPPFHFWAIAGDQDEFVPRASSIEPFPLGSRAVVPGDHLTIVHAQSPGDPGVRFVVSRLKDPAAKDGPADVAAVAVERERARAAVKRLRTRRGLDEDRLVELALALETLGRRDDAIHALEQQMQPGFTDAMGTLAGRYKRRWLLEGVHADGERALALYRQGYEIATGSKGPDQLLYLGINVAFMSLAWEKKPQAARRSAEEVLKHCADRPKDRRWALAAEGEARLLLGEREASLKRYREALRTPPTGRTDVARQNLSMYLHASRVASLVGDREAAEGLSRIFRGAALS